MQLNIILAVLFAAVSHAIWNSLIKGGKSPLLDSMLISLIWIIAGVIILPFLPIPDPQSWPFALATIFIHVSYFLLLSKAYNLGEFGRVYPIVRGLPPLIVTLFSWFFLEENIGFYSYLGVILISCGILILEIGNKIPSKKVFFLSLATALMISLYTIIDGIGARLSGNSTSFLLWFSLFQSIIFNIIVLSIRGRKKCAEHIVKYWKRGVFGGLLSISAYAIVLWAMTKAPIAQISALRETSVLFACIIAIIFLNEPLRISRIISAIIITTGIIIIKTA